MIVHVYRNRADDDRTREVLHFCNACVGWYGVPHRDSHCQKGIIARMNPQVCACRPCKEHTGQPIPGRYGFYTTAEEWQP